MNPTISAVLQSARLVDPAWGPPELLLMVAAGLASGVLLGITRVRRRPVPLVAWLLVATLPMLTRGSGSVRFELAAFIVSCQGWALALMTLERVRLPPRWPRLAALGVVLLLAGPWLAISIGPWLAMAMLGAGLAATPTGFQRPGRASGARAGAVAVPLATAGLVGIAFVHRVTALGNQLQPPAGPWALVVVPMAALAAYGAWHMRSVREAGAAVVVVVWLGALTAATPHLRPHGGHSVAVALALPLVPSAPMVTGAFDSGTLVSGSTRLNVLATDLGRAGLRVIASEEAGARVGSVRFVPFDSHLHAPVDRVPLDQTVAEALPRCAPTCALDIPESPIHIEEEKNAVAHLACLREAVATGHFTEAVALAQRLEGFPRHAGHVTDRNRDFIRIPFGLVGRPMPEAWRGPNGETSGIGLWATWVYLEERTRLRRLQGVGPAWFLDQALTDASGWEHRDEARDAYHYEVVFIDGQIVWVDEAVPNTVVRFPERARTLRAESPLPPRCLDLVTGSANDLHGFVPGVAPE
ncbi:MAG: hypothetical protein H6737_13840 [Alphaproteobacteria bacterium]|nr:hypothetical protein [Alphaproteobacteria bacterium]